jgi:hypothetical protein
MLVVFPINIAMAVACGALSNHFVEKPPFLRNVTSSPSGDRSRRLLWRRPKGRRGRSVDPDMPFFAS